MAMTITITDSTSSCTFLASTSSVQGSSASYDDANHKATLNWNDTATSTVSLAKDPETGDYITDSLMLNVTWGGRYRQAVVVVHKDAYACRWKVGSTTLSASTPSVTINGNVSVTATPLKNSAEVPTVSATEVAISNYWVSGVSPDGTKSGSWNYPATIKRGDSSIPTDYPYLISWKKPASSNRIMGYLVIEWKGWNSATPIYLSAGAMQFVAPETTAFTLDSQWWSGAEGTWLKHTVFTVYDKGIYPAISTVNDETDGDNVTERNKDTIKPYSIYAKFGNPPTLYTVSFYDDSGNYIKVENKDYTYTTVSGAKVVAPTGSSWIPTGYKLDGWYRKDGSGSWGTTLLSTNEVNNISVNNSDISFKAKFSLNVFTVTWKNWNGNVLETDTNVAYGSTPSYDGSTPTRATSGGYSYAFSSWSPTPVAVTANATYTAQFTATAVKYTVIWKDGIPTDEDPSGDGAVIKTDTDVPAGTLIQSLAPADPQRDGYIFSGWRNMPSYEEVRGDFTFVAQYEIVTKNIILEQKNSNGAWVEITRIPFTIDDVPKQISNTASKQSFEFLGWSLSQIGSNFSLPYIVTQWTGEDVVLYAKFKAKIIEVEPKPGYPGYDDENPDNDNDNYGIPIDYLDDGYKYKLKLRVVGDRIGTPIYDISVGDITGQSDGIWEWNYSSDVLTVSELRNLMTETLFVMDVWRCIVEHTTGVLEVTLETYDDGGYLDSDKKNNEFKAYDYMIPYIDINVVDDSSDVVPVEGVKSIEMLDLWANGLNKLFTKRFIGNGKSTVSVYITAHSEGWIDENKTVWGERLYGAVPVNYFCLLDSTEAEDVYEKNIPVYFDFSDDGDAEYRSPRLDITANPFPNIVHKNTNDWIPAELKIKVYDSRRMSRPPKQQEP